MTFAHSAHLESLAAWVANGECGSIVGLSNTGKSMLLRAASSASFCQQYFPQQNAAFFYVDCNLMLAMSEQGFYEATLRAVQAEIKQLEAAPTLLEQMENLYRKIIDPPSAFAAPLSFNESVVALCEQLGRRVIFLLDEFDEPFTRLDGRVFLNLRALRDRYGPCLCFVTATEKALPEDRSDNEVNEFNELFANNTLYLGMLAENEARQLVNEAARREGVTLDPDEISFVVTQAGGHPGLLSTVTNVLLRILSSASPPHPLTPSLKLSLAHQFLENETVVRNECSRLWNQLSSPEHDFLLEVLTQSEPPAITNAQERILKHGIVTNPRQPSVFSPLFEAFARRQFRARLPAQAGIYIDVDSGEVWVDGRRAPILTDLEYRLLLLLYGRLDKICDKYQVVEAVWGQDYIDEIDDSRVEKLVSRLRQKLEQDPAKARYFQTVRGRGYRLISG
ncbi:MAG: winged helix-turn-helix domain-containing protein [Thermoflexales bacterium]|nr:winged helix-turn-helix domain-containing protein [Thermoflexales bacterium]